MKPTLSNDGKLRYTITVKHRVAKREIVDCLLWFQENKLSEGSILFVKNRKLILELVRDVIEYNGPDVWALVEHLEREPMTKKVSLLFPDLD